MSVHALWMDCCSCTVRTPVSNRIELNRVYCRTRLTTGFNSWSISKINYIRQNVRCFLCNRPMHRTNVIGGGGMVVCGYGRGMRTEIHPSAAVYRSRWKQFGRATELEMTYVSEIFLPQLLRAATFGERPRQAADAAHLLFLAGSQRGCPVDRAGALKVCLRSAGIFDCKDWQNKKSAARATGHDHVAGDIPWAEP